MSKTEAIALAATFAQRSGYDTAQYNVRAARTTSHWSLQFCRKADQVKRRPGDFFTVYVNTTSKSVERLVPGK